jgi:hypothetical protein
MVARKLVALASLAFLATHCVEIDDRDLEEHDGDDDSGGSSNGGSSNGGSSNGGSGGSSVPTDCQRDDDDDDCFACEKARCCDEYTACLDSTDCTLYVYCGVGCVDDLACLLECGRSYPEGEAQFSDFTTCGDAACTDICGGA